MYVCVGHLCGLGPGDQIRFEGAVGHGLTGAYVHTYNYNVCMYVSAQTISF